jgi:tRNA(Phe) wybutosine-synthesizing methylase Tyw3
MNNQIYQTTDTPEASYLVSCGFNYKDVFALDNERIVFVFDLTDELNNEIIKFKSGKALVEPTKFLYNYKKLISEVRSLKSKKQQWQSKYYHQKNQTYYGKGGNYLR